MLLHYRIFKGDFECWPPISPTLRGWFLCHWYVTKSQVFGIILWSTLPIALINFITLRESNRYVFAEFSGMSLKEQHYLTHCLARFDINVLYCTFLSYVVVSYCGLLPMSICHIEDLLFRSGVLKNICKKLFSTSFIGLVPGFN